MTQAVTIRHMAPDCDPREFSLVVIVGAPGHAHRAVGLVALEGVARMLQPSQQSRVQGGGGDGDGSKVLMEPILQCDLRPCLWLCGLCGHFSALPRDSLSCSISLLFFCLGQLSQSA